MVDNIDTSASDFNENLKKIGNWAFKWKINFNPDLYKQAQEIKFSRKKTASLHPVVHFVNRPVKLTQIRKHQAMMLDSNLSHEHCIKSYITVLRQLAFYANFSLYSRDIP